MDRMEESGCLVRSTSVVASDGSTADPRSVPVTSALSEAKARTLMLLEESLSGNDRGLDEERDRDRAELLVLWRSAFGLG